MSKDKNMISFKELAKISGVSIGTLSRYFNNGAVSQKNKDEIAKNINKFGFIKNSYASSIKKDNDLTIIIRTFISSSSQDKIIEGITSSLEKNDVIVRYTQPNEDAVIEQMLWATQQRPKNLIVFSPINPSQKIYDQIKKIKDHSNLVFYDLAHDQVKNVTVSFKKAFQELGQHIKNISFVYSDKQDINTYHERIKLLKRFFNVTLVKNGLSLNTNTFYLFQFERLRIDNVIASFKQGKNIHNISISYEKPSFINKKDKWIFVDYFLVGVKIVYLLKNKNLISDHIAATLI